MASNGHDILFSRVEVGGQSMRNPLRTRTMGEKMNHPSWLSRKWGRLVRASEEKIILKHQIKQVNARHRRK